MIEILAEKNFHGLPVCAYDPYFSKSGYLPNHPCEYKEPLPYQHLPMNNGRINCFPPHMHRELEVHLIVSGSIYIVINGKERLYRCGDLVIINPFDTHEGFTVLTEEPLYYYFTILDLSYFSQVLPFSEAKILHDICRGTVRFCESVDASQIISQSEQIRSIFQSLHDRYTNNEASKILSPVYDLLEFILTHAARNTTKAKIQPDFAFVCQVSNLIETQYMTDLSTASVCDILSYSKSYFCRRFRECFGIPFMDYLNRYRLDRAMKLQIDANTSLTDIAASVGFNNYAYFSKAFHKYKGISPKQYFCDAGDTDTADQKRILPRTKA
ncbi:MAG: helix-turn-helix transcriptional regulator [Clostridia bacterium]|nr:helix-turn-helix transcriptional regulator [Clostridia bacterium]